MVPISDGIAVRLLLCMELWVSAEINAISVGRDVRLL